MGLSVTMTKSGAIVIRLPKSDLKRATRLCPLLDYYDDETGDLLAPKITDAQAFAGEVLRALNDEEEDGTTLVHKMFDEAINNAIEQGADGIVTPDDEDYGRKVFA